MENRHVIMHPTYGYVSKDYTYAGSNLQDAELFSDEDLLVILSVLSGGLAAQEMVIMSATEAQALSQSQMMMKDGLEYMQDFKPEQYFDTLEKGMETIKPELERGILSTVYADLKEGETEDSVRKAYQAAYEDEPFIHLLPQGKLPETKAVKGTNYCHLQVQVDERTHRLVILSVIDNLGKGAAGSAVQNMNMMFRLPETKGLKQVGLVP